jgi:hypothetical protein
VFHSSFFSAGSSLGLALGLSLGLGIPVLLGIITAFVFFSRRQRRKHTYLTSNTDFDAPRLYSSKKYYDIDNQSTMFLTF